MSSPLHNDARTFDEIFGLTDANDPAPEPIAAPPALAPAPATPATATRTMARNHNDAIDIDRVRDALSFLDPDCDRAMWVQIGMCIKNGLGDAGFDIWDQWSA